MEGSKSLPYTKHLRTQITPHKNLRLSHSQPHPNWTHRPFPDWTSKPRWTFNSNLDRSSGSVFWNQVLWYQRPCHSPRYHPIFILMFNVEIIESSWPVFAFWFQFYVFLVIGWLENCTNLLVFLIKRDV